MALSGPTEHLGEVGEETDGLPVSAAIDHGADQRPNIVFGDAAHRGLAECRQKVLVKAPLQFSIAVFPRHAIQQPSLGQILDGQRLHLRCFYLFGLYVSRGVCLCLGGFLVLVGIDLLIDERPGLVTGFTDVREGFARP